MNQSIPRGFTLVEIMVVVVVIGVFMAATIPSLMPDSRGKLLKQESKRLHAVIKLVREDAILDGREVALGVWKNGYSFYYPDDSEAGWAPVVDNKIYASYTLPDKFELEVAVEDADLGLDLEAPEEPQIYLFSTGEFTPFNYRVTLGEYESKTYAYDLLGRLLDES